MRKSKPSDRTKSEGKKSPKKTKPRKPRLRTGSPFGTFSKGNAYALALNFGTSGGAYCDIGCAHHPRNADPAMPRDCYAVRVEIRPDRQALANKLQRHEKLSPARLCGLALLELQQLLGKGARVDWLRISTNGAVPSAEAAQQDRLFCTAFRALLSFATEHGINVHFPTESDAKRAFYAELLVDLPVTVRESIHLASENDWEKFIAHPHACSTSVGAALPLVERIAVARDLASRRRAKTGRYVAVCPAVVKSFELKLAPRSDSTAKLNAKAIAGRAKCGTCDLCSRPSVDVIYPAH